MNDDEFWRQCVEWLVLIGALPRNHKTCYGNAVVFDLAQTLRDGVVLCNALNILHPGVIDESQVNHRAQMSEFLCMQNIRVVIYTLQTHFRIPRSELFTAEDLYRMEKFIKVLNALSCLSCLPEIYNYYKFSFQAASRRDRHRESFDHEDIYSNLEDLASERALADEEDDLYDSVPEEKEDGIYGSLIAVKKTVSTTSQKVDKRGLCIHEIVETENNYFSHLEMMVEQFLKPLRSVLQHQDLQIIFINIEQMRPIHKEFRDELVKLQQSSQSARFSEPFIKYKKSFLIYGEYCSKLVDATDHLGELMKNETVRLRVEDCQMNSSRNKFKLRELLCVPMQRVLKYNLLVKELIKHTPESHFDRANLTEALKSMQELSQYINEVKRDSEELIKINKIESGMEEYEGIPLNQYGRVRRDGELKVKFGDDKNQSPRNVFLFDKALFLTKLKNDSYTLKDLVRLEDMQLDEMANQKQSKAKWSSCWKLLSVRQGPTYVLYSKMESDKEKWLEAFKTAFDNINPRALKGKKHSFEMQTFAEPTECSNCKQLLKGIFYQGYECSVTSARCHKQCLADTLKLIENHSIGESTEGRNSCKAPPVPTRGKKTMRPEPSTGSVRQPVVASLSYKAHREYNGKPAPPPPFSNSPIITFQIGQPIDVIEQVTPDWWKGRPFNDYDRIGFFPASFVSPQSQRKQRPSYMQAEIRNPPSPSYRGARPMSSSVDDPPMEQMSWYAGEIDRTEAEKLLWDTPSGTFLIRRKQPQQLVISLKFQKDVKHIKILHTEEGLHYVAECKNFRSVQDLIIFYQSNSLSGFFLGLETTLKFPYRDPVMFPGRPNPSPTSPMRPVAPINQQNQRPSWRQHDTWNGRQEAVTAGGAVSVNGRNYEVVGRAKAKFDFEARSEQELSLRAGQVVNIISKAGGAHGWWKGEHNGQIGYFPTTFVEE